MLMWKKVLFDLDGTLTASGEGIKKSVLYALDKMGLPELDEATLDSFIGPPLIDSFMEHCGLSEEEARHAVETYRERYTVTGIFENELYDGIVTCLSTLKEAGFTLAVASSKPEVMVEQVLVHFDLRKYFDVVVGAELDGRRTIKSEVIEEALRQLGDNGDHSDIVYVGDRKYDIIGAHKNHLDVIGVLYGYGNFEELSAENPEYIAATPSMVLDIIMEKLVASTQVKETMPTYIPVRENPLFKIWRVIYPTLTYLLIVNAVAVCGMIFLMILSVAGIPVVDFEFYDGSMLMQLISYVVVIPILLLFYKRDEARRQVRPIPQGILKPSKERDINLPVLTVKYIIFFLLMAQATSFLIDIAQITAVDTAYQSAQEAISSPALWIQILEVCIFGPLVEEMVFRLLTYRRIRDYCNVKVAVILSAAMFGLFHMNFVQGIFAFVLGLFLAIYYEKTGNFWVPVLAHMANNFYSTLVEYFFGNSEFFGLWFYLVCIVLTVIMGIYLFKGKKSSRKNRN